MMVSLNTLQFNLKLISFSDILLPAITGGAVGGFFIIIVLLSIFIIVGVGVGVALEKQTMCLAMFFVPSTNTLYALWTQNILFSAECFSSYQRQLTIIIILKNQVYLKYKTWLH